MNTNGFIITRSFARELKSLGLSQIQTNIDSVEPEKHDYLRGKKDSFHRAVNALKNVRDVGITCVSQTVLTKKNEKEIVDVFRFARVFGIQRCRVWDMMPSKGAALDNINLKPSSYVESLKKLTRFAEETGGKHIESGEPFFPGEGFKTSLEVSHVPCVASHGVLVNFAYNGDVYYCVTQREKMFNVFTDMEGGFDGFYRGELDSFLEKRNLDQKCIKCKALDRCKGGCFTRRTHSENNMDYWCPSASNI